MTRPTRPAMATAGRVLLCCTLVGAAVVPSAAAAQSAVRGAADTVFAVDRAGVIDVSLRIGRLIVRGTDRAEAELRTSGQGFLLRRSGAGLSLSLGNEYRRGTRGGSGDGETTELRLPKHLKVIVRGAANDVEVSDIDGDVDVSVLSGDIALRAIGGRGIAETVSGDIAVTGGVGDFRASSVSGDVTARQVRGDIEVSTVSGEVVIDAVRSRRVVISASSGGVTLSSALPDDAEWQLMAHSGDVRLQLPSNAAGQLEVSTFNGDVTGGTMTLMPGTSTKDGRAVRQFEFGGGGSARIRASTFSGDISVIRSSRRDDLQ